MSSDRASHSATPVVSVEGLSKEYHLGELASLRRTAGFLIGGRAPAPKTLTALSRVSFSVERGVALGIVGANGSGKSTLLSVLSGIAVPSAGSAVVRGRLLPLLAVGAGFHPELSGRENVILFGAILGMEREVVLGQLDEIFAFGGVSDHIDTPVKRYSDGMKSRLSFGIAMQFPADVYLFDEVLAVVDGNFRTRCMQMVHRLLAEGTAVLLTSHDHGQIRDLCDRVLWLDSGEVRMIGETHAVMDAYVNHHGG